ncbi:HMG-box [Moniliophthora roreri MCA 2997]|uniref:HMG-box n=2 Tax=Moniliophthora roreri TaxID=221103 RepID=V2XCE1_MONRO|nr:HMG-box [Moniliophthora roreri MCA 2997]
MPAHRTPAHRTLSDAPRRSRRLFEPTVYDSNGYECLLEQEDDFNRSQYTSESTVSSSGDQTPPVFTMPSSMTSPTPEMPTRATTSHSRRHDDGHIRRPPNAFILFRSECCKNKGKETDETVISRLAGKLWGKLPADEKEVYQQRALQVAAEHSKLYPGYKYTPSHRNKPKVARRKPARDTVTEIRNCSDPASRIMRGQPLLERTPTPALSAPASDSIPVQREEGKSHPGHLAFSSSIGERDIIPTGLSSATAVNEEYLFMHSEYRGPIAHPEGKAFDCQEEFVATELMPHLDFNAIYSQTEAHVVEDKVEGLQRSYQQSPPLPSRADIDAAFGVKPTICNLQLAPTQALLTNSSGDPEVSSYASDASFSSPYEMTSSSSSLNEGLYYDYSGSSLYTPSSCEPASGSSQSSSREVDAMISQLYPTTNYFQSYTINDL